jgi:ACS family tartrate transporter-like MFS transporter
MMAWSQSSDRSGERHLHTAFAALLATSGLAVSAFAQSPPVAMLALSIAAIGTLAAMPIFWSLSTSFLSGAGAAVGIALINSIGNLAGFVGPYLVGWIKTATGDFSWALLTLALGPLATAVIVLRLRHLVK